MDRPHELEVVVEWNTQTESWTACCASLGAHTLSANTLQDVERELPAHLERIIEEQCGDKVLVWLTPQDSAQAGQPRHTRRVTVQPYALPCSIAMLA